MPLPGVAFGFALPNTLKGQGAFGNDFLMNVTVSLPYGFASLQSTVRDTKRGEDVTPR